MTVEIDIGEKPSLIAPKKRLPGKKSGSTGSHVDHIIVIQGASNMTSAKMHTLADAVGVLNHKTNGNSGPRVNGFKNHHIMDLPIIPDDDDEKAELSPIHMDLPPINEKSQTQHKNGYQPLTLNLHSSREIVDLSPIYENSSDACSSHDDIRGSINDIVVQRNCKLFIEDNNDSNSATPNSLSQTQSETSLEMGLLSESQKHSSRKSKKRVNIVSDLSVQCDDVIETENSTFKCDSEGSGSPDRSVLSSSTDGYLTMTGTIKRGKKKGQNIDVKLNISREELEILEAAIVAKEISKAQQWFKCTMTSGFHIMIWSFLCMPGVMVMSGLYSFYIGTLTWYNIFIYISEGDNLWMRVFASPFVILMYPFFILIFTLGLGLYAGFSQLTCCGQSWWKEVCDLEKGFYGWLCGLFHLSDCSPYEVVILTDLKVVENTDMRGNSSTEDISI